MEPITMSETADHKEIRQDGTVTGVTASLIASDVLTGLICGIFAVFLVAWVQGGTVEIDLSQLIDAIRNWANRIYPR